MEDEMEEARVRVREKGRVISREGKNKGVKRWYKEGREKECQ